MDTAYSSPKTDDLEKKSKDFLDAVILNIILTELSDDLRKQYYSLVESDRLDEVRDFALKNIPDFQDKLSKRVKELLQ